MDLWGFKDKTELIKDVKEMPDMILKDQVDALEEKTEYFLRGKTTFVKVKTECIGYEIAMIFDVVVPCLDNYSKTILIMYSKPDQEYPLAITVGKSYLEDCENFNPDYVCNNKEEFIKSIKKILSSDETMNMLRILYAKAAIY